MRHRRPAAVAAACAAVAAAAVLATTVTGCRQGATGAAGAEREATAAATSTAVTTRTESAPPATGGPPATGRPPSSTAAPSGGPTSRTVPPPVAAAEPASPWQVGARPLPLRADGFGQVLPTPQVLRDRRLATRDRLPPPPGDAFTSAVRPVPADVLRRSTWQPGCPVRADELRYVTVAFWGFDGRHHTGELLVNAKVATGVVSAFRAMHAARFPLEEVRVVAAAELDAAPTGDGNNTTAFVCRPARGQTRWSAHAYGLAIDVNPFCNPYTRGDLVLPELASAYLDRGWLRPGMLHRGEPVLRAFAAIGWTWGGTWSSPRDLMHLSATGN